MLEFEDVSPPARLPLHPHPRPLEPLGLWIERIAGEYGARYRPFCRLWLGLQYWELVDLNRQPSPALLSKITNDTRVPTGRLLQMTTPALLVQLQNDLGVGIGAWQQGVCRWLTEVTSDGGRAREYWEVIDYWQRGRQFRIRHGLVA